ncbi:MAG: CDGSH iron-sulfur domain-containing protein [Terriglobales bacterium]
MPEVTITVRRNGSLKVEGPFRLIDSNGQEIPLPADKPVVSFCRCGHSQNKPFCDGSHREHNFQGAEAHILRAEEVNTANG